MRQTLLRIPIPGTNGLAVELTPRGFMPQSGTTHFLFIQDITGKRHLNLDFSFNKNGQHIEWHWNQKGTFKYFLINQGGDLWDALVKSRRISVHAHGEIMDPQMELLIVLPS